MIVLGRSNFESFKRKHANSRSALDRFEVALRNVSPSNFAQLRKTFGSADIVGDYTVFNVGGNKYRVIAEIWYRTQQLEIVEVLTHGEYDKGGWKK